MTTYQTPKTTLERLAQLGTENLTRVIAIDSQSDERSETIPSTEGQRTLAADLSAFFGGLGYTATSDAYANLLVEVPATPGCETLPKLALLIHMDTSRGTEAIERLETLQSWDGTRVPYPKNDQLQVTVDNYPETRDYLGEDILFGPGRYPIGLDDKLGLSELMTLAQVLATEPEIPHGEILIVCRPDEEIGRMEAVRGLADELARRGVKYGYTIDGLGPFEVQVENFNASKGVMRVSGRAIEPSAGAARTIMVRVNGCKAHGATAKPEGYLNATVIVARAQQVLSGRGDVLPIGFQSDLKSEVDAEVTFLMTAASEDELDGVEEALLGELKRQIEAHRWKGAGIEVLEREEGDPAGATEALARALDLIQRFISSEGPQPLLSEESDGRQGYSNPYFMEMDGGAVKIEYRLRAFARTELDAREEHLRSFLGDGVEVEIEQQYINMCPSLKPYPELVDWATDAARAVGFEPRLFPIRGGTGVDPFLERNIPIANLGTGYFAPESEKELTSRQKIAQHAAWLVQLVQRVT